MTTKLNSCVNPIEHQEKTYSKKVCNGLKANPLGKRGTVLHFVLHALALSNAALLVACSQEFAVTEKIPRALR